MFRVSEAKKTFGLLKNWKIQDALLSHVDVLADNVTHFSIGGEKISVATLKEAPSNFIVLYPGVYTFTPEETGEYIDAAPKTMSVKAATGHHTLIRIVVLLRHLSLLTVSRADGQAPRYRPRGWPHRNR